MSSIDSQTFSYIARNQRGDAVTGTVEAGNVGEASSQIRAAGNYPVSVRPAGAGGAGRERAARPVSGAGVKISRKEVIQFSQQLAIMIETGVTLSEAMDCIAAQSAKPNLKALLTDIGQQLHSGIDFSTALSRHPRSFPRVYVALIKAAEKSGMMSKLIARANAYMRDEQDTIRKVRGALTYPAIMLSFAFTTTIFLLAFVLPRFTVIYANKGAALPLPTKILMTMSDIVVGNWVLLLIGTVASVVAFLFALRTERGARMWHFAQLNAPLLGELYRKLHLSRGLRMIGTMAGAGVNLVDCVATAHDLCDNSYFGDLWSNVRIKITGGRQMSEPLGESPLVPKSVAHMIHSAERSGKLAQVTEQVAGFAEVELKETIANLTRYIEPAMIVVMGLIIGGVSLALMLPIFTISRVVAQ